jgi:tRNA(Arg) A34 adenosine deaminase TadA
MLQANHQIMRAAIEAAEKEKAPFGTALAMGGEVFVTSASHIADLEHPEKHAVMIAMAALKKYLQQNDLSGFVLYSTCEPCEVCIRQALKYNIDFVFYGIGIQDWIGRHRSGGRETFRNPDSDLSIEGGFMEAECNKLLEKFR